MTTPRLRGLPPGAQVSVMILAVAEFIGGSLALRGTLIHSAEYANGVQWWAEITVSSLLCIAGLALLRGWRWAARPTGIVLYLFFLLYW